LDCDAPDIFDAGCRQHIGKLLFRVGLARIGSQKHVQGEQRWKEGASMPVFGINSWMMMVPPPGSSAFANHRRSQVIRRGSIAE
jgi:hypothetical protein